MAIQSAPPNQPSLPQANWAERIRHAEKTGDYLGACDAAILGLEQYPEARELQYSVVLNLSRAGAGSRAEELWQHFDLGAVAAGSGSLALNIASLGARLHRERALAQPLSAGNAALKSAAEQYAAIYRTTENTFPGINAAVLHLLSDDHATAQQIAADLIRQLDKIEPDADHDLFNLAADRAAALLVLDQQDQALKAIELAASAQASTAAIASTRKQLLQICTHKGIDPAILAGLRNRAVIHYTGHMISAPDRPGRFPADQEQRVAAAVRRIITERGVGFGHGSLASGADLLIVEALLAQAGAVEAVLPFEPQSFEEHSVANGGAAWVERFRDCVGRVQVTEAMNGTYAGDPEIFAYTSRLAMGMAILKAHALGADLFQLAVWDGQTTDHPAGTAADIKLWAGCGQTTVVIESGGVPAASLPPRPPEKSTLPPLRVRAIMFGDFRGFSRLKDGQMITFVAHVMTATALVLDRFAGSVLTQNTWGDGLFVVFDGLPESARCALEIQAALAALDLAALDLPANLGLRLALHAGAVFEIQEPVLKSVGFTGGHISRTARLEPVTPAGEVYVTEAFAALLALQPDTGLVCDYVGSMPAAKGYGRLRMYLLKSSMSS